MKELKERLEIEKEQWIENYMKKQVGYKNPRLTINTQPEMPVGENQT